MFKKGLITITVLLSLGFLVSCAMQQGPLSPSTTLLGPANSSNTEKPILTPYADPVSSSSPAIFEFRNSSGVAMEMDAATLNSTTIQVFYKTSDTEETQLTGISIVYHAALKQVSISHPSNWTDNTRYRVLFTTGIKTVSGAPLDGNGNGIAESSNFDNAHHTFYRGTPGWSSYSLSPLQINVATLTDAAGGSFNNLANGNLNSVQAGAYIHVTITVTFSTDVDQSRVFVDSTTLHTNFSVVNDATNAPIAPVNVAMISNAVIQGVFIFPANTRYRLTVMGGDNGVRSTLDSAVEPLRGRYFDDDDPNGVAEANDKVVRYITTVQAGGTLSNEPPTVDTCSYSGGTDRFWTVIYDAPETGVMNASSIVNTANYQLEANYADQIYNVSIKAIEWVSDTSVRIYVPDAFYPASGDSQIDVSMHVNIKRNVTDSDGNPLDGNEDGAGGTVLDDFRSVEATVQSSYFLPPTPTPTTTP